MMRSCRFSDTSHVFTLMVICFITLFSSSVHGQGKIRRFKWEVKYELKSPNCFEKLVITINGQFPGPTIKVQQGDTIIVELKNSFMTENVAVHWHGIRQALCSLIQLLNGYISLKEHKAMLDQEKETRVQNLLQDGCFYSSTCQPNNIRRLSSRLLVTPQRSEAEACNASNADCSRFVLTVIPGKTYRLRIGSLTSLSALSFQIEAK
ncbi:hypothetical protein Bca52824_093146 [Brassica carinata]|uniref:Plastocyanin-like domain-containing protein n=1 Tax=Brassica carinata TaxID=52824 RepID=A0A8X7P4J0_BRACI|nr:hypothetical protein Bca52824_093146 [Brassica carinata]